jgi:hypothetical protein
VNCAPFVRYRFVRAARALRVTTLRGNEEAIASGSVFAAAGDAADAAEAAGLVTVWAPVGRMGFVTESQNVAVAVVAEDGAP